MRKSLVPLVYLLLLALLMSCNFTINGNTSGSGNEEKPPVIDDPSIPEEKILSPYPSFCNYSDFIQGATYELPQSPSAIFAELREAKEKAHLNSITVYGLENVPEAAKDVLFAALDELDMKIAVRIESYDSDFAFRVADAEKVVAAYAPLIRYLSDESRSSCIAYFALNMPVDDGDVQDNAGGLNTSSWINAQREYAEELVRLMKEEMAACGLSVPLYLSVFYGWNNDFRIPSYASAGADGYFMNNYSYPIRGYNYSEWESSRYEDLPSVSWSDSDLINAQRLAISLETYIEQYTRADGTLPPLVMEWGIHTADYNNKKPTQQSAGLVKDIEAKKNALTATYEFYSDYDFVQGFMYFGYNLLKAEGSDNAIMDWCLNYD